ncbi:MAG: bacterioferritin, partial [Chloroflexota bacterium]
TRIQQLGGVPVYDPAEIARMAEKEHVRASQGSTVQEMLLEDLEVERRQVKAYTEFIREVGDKDIVTRRLLERILEDTEHHAAELADILSCRTETR